MKLHSINALSIKGLSAIILLQTLLSLGYAQTVVQLNIDQPEILKANAGPDLQLCSGCPGQLSSSVAGGTPPYVYTWSPALGLSDSTSDSPQVSLTSSQMYLLTVRDSRNCTHRDSVWVRVESTSGFTWDGKQNGSIEILPNPNKGTFYIRTDAGENNRELTISVFDLRGGILYRESIPTEVTRSFIPMEHLVLPPGAYLFRMQSGAIVHTQKILVEID